MATISVILKNASNNQPFRHSSKTRQTATISINLKKMRQMATIKKCVKKQQFPSMLKNAPNGNNFRQLKKKCVKKQQFSPILKNARQGN